MIIRPYECPVPDDKIYRHPPVTPCPAAASDAVLASGVKI
jgi:hypothetical protein